MRLGSLGGITLRFGADIDVLEFLNRGFKTVLEERRWLRIGCGERAGDEHERDEQGHYYHRCTTSCCGSSTAGTGTLHDPPPGLMRKNIEFLQTTTVKNDLESR
jgi:hypothetical protein